MMPLKHWWYADFRSILTPPPLLAPPPLTQLGRMLDCVYRPLGLGMMLLLQGASIALSAGLLAAAAAGGGPSLVSSPLFGSLIFLTMLEKATSISSELAIERDWVTQLAGVWC